MLANRDIGKFLEPNSKEILKQKAGSLRTTLQRKRKVNTAEWRLAISPKNPLTFITNDCHFQVDISCEIEGIGDLINKQNMLIRIWSCDNNTCFRNEMDAAILKEKIEQEGGKRVMLRFHIDRRTLDLKNPEPCYHLHVGGIPDDSENCWIPKQIKEPRFPFPPMDLILLSEFVLVNFFPIESKDLREKPEWKSLVKKSQEIFIRPYFTECVKFLNSPDTLMGNLVKQS